MTANKMASIILGIVVVGVAAALALTQPRAGSNNYLATPEASTSTVPTATSTPPTGYTMAQVLTHATTASCWSAVNGSVYDLTLWIIQHPGGEGAILSMCGTDSSAAFNAQHGSQRQPERILASYRIGTLIR